MLTPYSQSKFIEKIFTDVNGRQFRLVFLVAIVNGELKGRLVSAQPIASSFKYESAPCLPACCSKDSTVTEYIPSFTPVVSPYNELLFFVSQPTRAPSVK